MTMNMKGVKMYLRSRGIPPSMVDQIRLAFANDAVQNSNGVQADRIYTLLALTLHEEYGFGHQRIFRGLQRFDQLNAEAAESYKWPELMERLQDETGIVITTNTEERIAFEYRPKRE